MACCRRGQLGAHLRRAEIDGRRYFGIHDDRRYGRAVQQLLGPFMPTATAAAQGTGAIVAATTFMKGLTPAAAWAAKTVEGGANALGSAAAGAGGNAAAAWAAAASRRMDSRPVVMARPPAAGWDDKRALRAPGESKRGSGRGVTARAGPEIADQRNNRTARDRGALTGAKRRVATHRFVPFAFPTLGGGPYRVGLKENNRAFLVIRHDRHSSQTTRKS